VTTKLTTGAWTAVCNTVIINSVSSVWLISLNSVLELLSVIVKYGDDLRQECLASQLLEQFKVGRIMVFTLCVLVWHVCVVELVYFVAKQ